MSIASSSRGADDVCNKALDWAFAIRMPPHPKLLLLDLADHKNTKTGLCCPSLKSIQERTGLNRAQILHYSTCLQTAGLIHIEKGNARSVNRYVLNVTVTLCEPLRFTRPPRRGSHGYPVTRKNQKDNQNTMLSHGPNSLREPAREQATPRPDTVQLDVSLSKRSGKVPGAKSKWPTHKMCGYAKKRGVDPGEAADAITAEFGAPPSDKLGENTEWARAFYAVVEGIAGGFVDAVIAGIGCFDDDDTPREEAV